MNVYSLHDRQLRQFGQLMLERNDFGIQRGLADGIASHAESIMFKHPGDFDLFQVAEFDEESGVVTPLMPPRRVCGVDELVGEVQVPSPTLLKREG